MDPGTVLFLSKQGGRARLDWSGAPALGAGEHHHLVAGREPWMLLERPRPERAVGTSWRDPEPGGRRWYRLRAADECERESRWE